MSNCSQEDMCKNVFRSSIHNILSLDTAQIATTREMYKHSTFIHHNSTMKKRPGYRMALTNVMLSGEVQTQI